MKYSFTGLTANILYEKEAGYDNQSRNRNTMRKLFADHFVAMIMAIITITTLCVILYKPVYVPASTATGAYIEINLSVNRITRAMNGNPDKDPTWMELFTLARSGKTQEQIVRLYN